MRIYAMLLLWIMATNHQAEAQAPTQWDLTQQFIGQWSGQADLDLGGSLFVVTYNLDFKSAVDGSAMTMDESFDDPALGSFRGANLIGLNATDGLIHWFSADNFGTAHEHTGSWVNPRHFYMVHESLAGGQTFREEIHFRMRANGTRMIVDLVATLDGAIVQTISGTIYKQQQGNRISADEPQSKGSWEVYPNPSGGTIYVESEVLVDEVYIVNELGQEVFHSTPNYDFFSCTIDTPGMYVVTIRKGSLTENKRLIVQD